MIERGDLRTGNALYNRLGVLGYIQRNLARRGFYSEDKSQKQDSRSLSGNKIMARSLHYQHYHNLVICLPPISSFKIKPHCPPFAEDTAMHPPP
jgi:hypothetical protein